MFFLIIFQKMSREKCKKPDKSLKCGECSLSASYKIKDNVMIHMLDEKKNLSILKLDLLSKIKDVSKPLCSKCATFFSQGKLQFGFKDSEWKDNLLYDHIPEDLVDRYVDIEYLLIEFDIFNNTCKIVERL